MKKKGFTLVELLAVIAILAILVIIALPNVMKLFNRAKENAFTTELKEIYKVAQQQWIADSMFNTQERVYVKTNKNNCSKKLDMTGRSELEYYIKINKSGNVIAYYATDGSYQYSYNGTDLKIEDIENIEQISKIDEYDVISIYCSGAYYAGEEPIEGPYYQNLTSNKKYDSLQIAINESSNNQTIKVIKDSVETSPVTIPSNKTGLIIDLNGHKIDFDLYNHEYIIINNSSLEINNSGSEQGSIYIFTLIQNNGTLDLKGDNFIMSQNSLFENNGILNVYDGQLTAYEGIGIDNSGTVNIYGGELGADSEGIINDGTVNITGGKVSGRGGIVNNVDCIVNISNNSYISGYRTGISNQGILNVENSEIRSSGGDITTALYNYNNGVATLRNVVIDSEIVYRQSYSYGIKISGGKVNFYSGTIHSKSNNYYSYGVYNEAEFNMYDGDISVEVINDITRTYSRGIYSSGTTTIEKGTINAIYLGIIIESGITTIGKNDSNVSSTTPQINATGTNGYGIKINNGTLKFYDGVITSKKGDNSSISNPNNTTIITPSNYVISKAIVDGAEVATLIHSN